MTDYSMLPLPDVGAVPLPGVAALSILILLVLLWKLSYAFLISPLRGVPGPVLARLTPTRAMYNRAPGRVTQAMLADYRVYGDIYVSRPDTVCISHPDDVRAVLGSKDFRKVNMYRGLDDPVMANLVTFSDPALANRRRRQVGPYFSSQAYLGKMEPLILEQGYLAIRKKWDAMIARASGRSVEVNYRYDTQLATFNIMSSLAFGRRSATEADAATIVDWVSATAVYVGVSMNFKRILSFPLSLLIRPWLRKYRAFAAYGRKSVSLRKQELASGKREGPSDMLQAFIDAEDPDSNLKVKMTPVEVQAESVGMLLAGSETTSAALTWAFHLFTLYPDYYRRATNEIRQRFPPNYVITFTECRNSAPFLESFVYELLRYTPITAGFMPRYSDKGFTLRGHYIPPGTNVAFNLIALNNRSDMWHEPDKFIADRFVDNEEAKRNVFAFSYGPRSCIGRNLAWVEIMTILANLLKDYDLSLPNDSVFGPHNVGEDGTPRLMPSRCHIVFAPTHADRDCRLVVSRRKLDDEEVLRLHERSLSCA